MLIEEIRTVNTQIGEIRVNIRVIRVLKYNSAVYNPPLLLRIKFILLNQL
jgi:hypothetical protein